MARQARDPSIAEEMLAGLQTFAHDLRNLKDEEVKSKYRHRTLNVDLKPRQHDAQSVKEMRDSMDCSQAEFADFLGVSLGTLRNWERGLRPVSGAASRLLDEMRINPDYWRARLTQSLKRQAV